MFFGCFLEIFISFSTKKAPCGTGADQDGPRWLMMAPDGPRWCRRWTQEGPRWPEMAQDGRKMASSWPQDCPKWLVHGPRWPQDGPNMAQDGSKWPKIAPLSQGTNQTLLNAGVWLAQAVNETTRPQNAGAQPGNEPNARRTQAPGSLSQGTNQTSAERRRLACSGCERNQTPAKRRRVARSARERTRCPHNAGAWLAF